MTNEELAVELLRRQGKTLADINISVERFLFEEGVETEDSEQELVEFPSRI